MSKDIDEDLIEATIRRVQAQKAPDSEQDPDTDAGDPETADEDSIEATIRRVQAQASARSESSDEHIADEPHDEPANAAEVESQIRRLQASVNASRGEPPVVAVNGAHDSEELDPIEATIRRVQAQAAARDDAAESAGDSAEPGADEDDPIAATIRRVQAQAASRSEESSQFAPTPLPSLDDDDEDVVEEAIQFAEKSGSEEDASLRPAARHNEHPLEETSWPGRDQRLLGQPATWEVAAQRLEVGMQETNLELRALAARFDALLPALERFLASPDGAPLSVVPPASSDDDWDDSPRVSGMQVGDPPRPVVLRDPSPHTATAAELVSEPAAAMAPRLRTLDKDGNLDERFPRQYRITVEDKRRGVDLVPLHRAIQGMQNVKDMSLLSYSNGVAIVALETIGGIDPNVLGEAVARAMSRETKVEVHNEQTMVVKIQEE
jgi:hypothetical protein